MAYSPYGKGGINYNEATNKQKKAIERNERRINNDVDFVRSEIERAQNVISNRQNEGMDTSAQVNYLNKLQSKLPKERTVSSSPSPSQPQYSTDPVNIDQFRTEEATISDLANKYGFDYSRDYAQSMAEKLAQKQKNDIKEQKESVSKNVTSATDSLDRDYFQKYMNQAQQQVNNGQNAGVADNQNLRLAMNRQAELGDVYRDANQQRYELNNALAEINPEQMAEQMHQERLQQAFQNAMSLTNQRQQDNLAMLQAAMQQRGQNIDMSQFAQNLNEQQRQFNQNMDFNRDQFGWEQEVDQRNFNTQQEQQDFMNTIREAQLTGTYNGQETTAEQQRQFENELAMQQFNRPYNELTAYQKAQLAMQQQQIAASYANSGGGGNGGNSSSAPDILDIKRLQDIYQNGGQQIKSTLESQYPQLFGGGSEPSRWERLQVLNSAQEGLGDLSNVSDAEAEMWVAQNVPKNQDKALEIIMDQKRQLLTQEAEQSGGRSSLLDWIQGTREEQERDENRWKAFTESMGIMP